MIVAVATPVALEPCRVGMTAYNTMLPKNINTNYAIIFPMEWIFFTAWRIMEFSTWLWVAPHFSFGKPSLISIV